MSLIDVRLRAMAHGGRRLMIRGALSAERSASELAAMAGLSRPATSQHLAALVDAGLMAVRDEGRHRWYRTERRALDELREELAAFWDDRLHRLRRAAET